MNIHPVFYISFLELVFLGVLPAPVIEIELVNLNTKYNIKKILDYK
jgi:hypothetical protein